MQTTPPADSDCKCKHECECEIQKIKTQGEVDSQLLQIACKCKKEELDALWMFREKVYVGLGNLAGQVIDKRQKSAIELIDHTTSVVFKNLRCGYTELAKEILAQAKQQDKPVVVDASLALEIISEVTKVLQTALQQLPAIVRSGNEAAEAYAQVTGPGDGENRGSTQSGSSGSSGGSSASK